jgi:hypothetical protein
MEVAGKMMLRNAIKYWHLVMSEKVEDKETYDSIWNIRRNSFSPRIFKREFNGNQSRRKIPATLWPHQWR